MIRLQHVTQHYGVRPVLRDVDLEIPAGGLVAVVGPNGMGKSTLLRVVAGLLEPQVGHCEIDGLRRRSSEANELAIRRRVAYLPDHPWLPLNRTGREFLLAVGQLYGVESSRLFDHVDRLFALFDLGRESDWPIGGYSNGQKKKVAIAAVLATDAPILLMDELFGGGLDPAGVIALKRVLRHLAARDDVTVLMSAPAPELLEEFAERVIVLQEGRVLAYDTPARLCEQAGKSSLAAALERLVFPEAQSHIEAYLRGEQR
ncbi:MAG: ABC transporter ATP-binding protein [Pirellulales bacterium]|nr:ABC transporter ATP-binding protein [Pirellulales bacterium]